MRNTFRRILSLILCIALCLCLIPEVRAEDSHRIVIPNSVTVIDDEAFLNCSSMTSVTIPSSVTRIGNRAFYGCTGLTDVYYEGTVEQWDYIFLGTGNGPLTRASIHCIVPPPGDQISLIVAFQTGSSTDNTARILAKYAEKYVGKSIVVENISGGSGSIGWSQLANANPDGQTIGFINLPNFSNSIVKMMGTYTIESFAPICNHVTETSIVIVRADDNRFPNLNALVEYGKANEGGNNELKASTNGPQASNHIGAQAFANSAEFKYIDIPQGGTADQLLSLRYAEADFTVVKLADIVGQESEYRILGVFNDERLPELPDVPTLKELGYYDGWLGSSRCLVAPAGVSEEVIAFYEAAFKAAMEDPDYIAAAEQAGMATDFKDAAATGALIVAQQAFAESLVEGFWPEY